MITERTLKLLEDDVMRVYDYEYNEVWANNGQLVTVGRLSTNLAKGALALVS
jgi:hypothetical protein